jgi:N-acetylglucosaminyldiphosphoundecaprenol N-acetyl-beta-D-mannosaminyltransferase
LQDFGNRWSVFCLSDFDDAPSTDSGAIERRLPPPGIDDMVSNQRVLGFDIDCMSMDEVVGACLEMIRGDRRPRIIATLNAAVLVESRRDARLRQALHSSALLLADGMPVAWISRVLGARSAHRVTGIDLMAELLCAAGREKLRLFFLGASPDVLRMLVDKVGAENGGAVIVGACHGYFRRAESAAIVDQIRESRADILFVGMPSPFKEIWCQDNLERLDTPVILPVGGAFDVLSGAVRRAPRGMQVCGMEWLWRLLVEPRRKWRRYVETNPVFLGLVARAALRRIFLSWRHIAWRTPVSRFDPIVLRSLPD